MMKLSFDKRLDEDIMKAYCTDFQIIETRFINSSEFFITPTSVGNGSGITGGNGTGKTR